MTSTFALESHQNLSAIHRLLPEWRSLYIRSNTDNPFAHPIWALAWLEHFARDKASVVTVRDPQRDAELVGLAAFYRRSVRKAGLAIPSLLMTGVHIDVARGCSVVELPQILTCDRGDSPRSRAIVSAIVDFVTTRSGWGMLNLRLPPDQGAGIASGRERIAGPNCWHYADPVQFIVLSLPSDEATWKSGLRPNVKEAIRKGQVRPQKDGLAAKIVVVREPERIIGAVREVIRLHRSRAASGTGVEHFNFVPDQESARFLEAVALQLAAEDAIAVYLWQCETAQGARTVAGRIVLETEHSIFTSLAGMDVAYWKYNFPTTLMFQIITDAIQRGKTTANLSSGIDRSKTRWMTSPDHEIQHAQSLFLFRASDPRAFMASAYLRIRQGLKPGGLPVASMAAALPAAAMMAV
jgi:hypothetical protein